jgi:hypothetical protein
LIHVLAPDPTDEVTAQERRRQDEVEDAQRRVTMHWSQNVWNTAIPKVFMCKKDFEQQLRDENAELGDKYPEIQEGRMVKQVPTY